MQLDYLKGKSILEVIADFSKFEWMLMDQIRPVKTKLKTLVLVYYDRNKPRQEVDLYNHVDVHNTAALDELIFRRHDDRTLGGIISKVQLGQPFEEHEYKYAHIPMIDFDMHNDFDFLSEEEKINLIKSKIEEDTEINSGVILKSGPKKNYHFMGIGQLLSEDDFITFVGLALRMHIIREDKKINLADSRHLGHGLSPMKYMAELENEENPESQWSRYFFRERFLTLRIQPKPGYLDLPRVVDVMNPEIH